MKTCLLHALHYLDLLSLKPETTIEQYKSFCLNRHDICLKNNSSAVLEPRKCVICNICYPSNIPFMTFLAQRGPGMEAHYHCRLLWQILRKHKHKIPWLSEWQTDKSRQRIVMIGHWKGIDGFEKKVCEGKVLLLYEFVKQHHFKELTQLIPKRRLLPFFFDKFASRKKRAKTYKDSAN